MTMANYVQSIRNVKLELRRWRSPHHRANLSLVVFECEIRMARLRTRIIRDLAHDPHAREFALERALDLGSQLRDRKRLLRGGRGRNCHRRSITSQNQKNGAHEHAPIARQDTTHPAARRFTLESFKRRGM